jgi:hypothetical protein
MIEIVRQVPERLVGVGLPLEVAIKQAQDVSRETGEITRREFRAHRPFVYRNPGDADHGLQHTGETVGLTLLGARFARYYGFNVNYYKAGLIAAYHDSQHSGTIDDDHGQRAAEWIIDNLLYLGEDRFIIAQEVEDHVPHDKPGISDNLRVVKDADSLNRVRFHDEEDGLDLGFLRFEYSKELLVPIALQYHWETEELINAGFGDGYDCAEEVFINKMKLGLDW